MAERSTAAVDVADNSGDKPLTAKADEATADGTAQAHTKGADPDDANGGQAGPDNGQAGPDAVPPAPDLHSGHKLAKRYRLEECVTRLDGFSSWRAVDEKLRRAVGVHLLPADHPRARSVLAAARSSALLGDPRFVQVLDAVEEDDLVYVVHEWLPDATELTALLAAGPLEAHDAYQLVSQISQAMAAAHREGLSHLRLTPGAVLRSSTGQYRIRGLAVNAALRGVTAERPSRTDTEAVGALLYAALTRRWPYENDAYGLSGLPKDLGLIPPDQVRAGVHRGLSELAMRALANDGATASRQEQPCTTPDELAKAVAAMPRVLPPEPAFTAPPEYQRTTYQQGTFGRPSAVPAAATQPIVQAPPPPLQSRTGKVLKWAVSALLIAALGLGSWQLAETVLDRSNDTNEPTTTQNTENDSDDNKEPEPSKPVSIIGAKDYDPLGNGVEKPDSLKNAYDGDTGSYWPTDGYYTADFGKLKEGVGVVLDLGEVQRVSKVDVSFLGGETSVELRTTDSSSIPQMPGGFTTVARGTGTKVSLTADKPVQARYLLVWLTKLPYSSDDGKYRGKVADIKVTS
ncbi:serine/threonine protein kinase [Streptomyces sp. NBC_01754]|uniref:serine/threonine protein kinase n=1 Tax=Streptomyces sp. NBC_01754 TaxID=2975930 RepID=UPI002DD8AFEC|nr:serine/threonine protein kinase [Streptomyces sp. NBC_01754]WSC93625.1 serine/threonine protein kinase [Streptomyces sp. NBC_01754]